MKICHIYHHYHPVLGGLERVVQKIAEEQAKEGDEVHVVTSTLGSKDERREETVNDVHIHRLRAIRLHYPDLMYPLDRSRHVFEDSDVLHVHSQNSLFNIAMGKRAERIGKPVVIDFLGLDYLNSHTNGLIRFFGRSYQEIMQRKAANIADSAVTLNERDHRILEKKYRLESKVVPHGIDEGYLKKPKDDRLFREKYDLYDRNVVAYVGRVHPSKGLETLVKAAPLVAREVDSFMVVIAGGGSTYYKQKLTRLAEKLGVEHVFDFLGYVGEAEKLSLLDSTKVFVFPTRHFGEAYPLVVDETYARGVPIIATKVGVLPQRIKDMQTGILVPPDNPSTLARAISALLKDDKLLTRMRVNIQSVRRTLLTWRQVCKELDKIYQDAREN